MEEEVNENVKTKAPVMNKHLIMGLAMVIIVAVIIAVVALANKEKVVDYKEQIKEFAKACGNKEDMKKFVKEKVNLKAFYAMSQSEEPEDFEELYKNAKSEEYENNEFIENVVNVFETYSEEGTNLEVKDIEDLKDIETDKTIIGKTLSEIKGVKVSRFTMVSEGVEMGVYAYLYDEKIFMIMPDFTSMGNEYQENE